MKTKIPVEELYASAQRKIAQGRKNELTSAEAGALGGYPVKMHFLELAKQAAANGNTIVDEMMSDVDDEDTISPTLRIAA